MPNRNRSWPVLDQLFRAYLVSLASCLTVLASAESHGSNHKNELLYVTKNAEFSCLNTQHGREQEIGTT